MNFNSFSEIPSEQLAQFIEKTDGISKPWLLVLLRLRKLQERRDDTPEE